MSQTKAHPEKHGSHTSKVAEQEADRLDVQPGAPTPDPVPAPEEGSHAHSHAAHLHTPGDVHTEAAGNQRQAAAPGALRQPPSIAERSGKQHR